jgi:hypothetical protein
VSALSRDFNPGIRSRITTPTYSAILPPAMPATMRRREEEDAMKIGILSDIHDNLWNLRAALGGLGEADALICCGDLCSPFVVGLLAEGFPGRPIHVVAPQGTVVRRRG